MADNSSTDWRRARAALIDRLSGDILEIGPGDSPTLPSRGTWVGIEPDRRRYRRLSRLLAKRRTVPARAVRARAEELPLPAASIDTAVSCWALCSVDRQDDALREIARVLRPGGTLVVCEHVGARPGGATYSLQRAVAPITRVLDHGCDPSRQTQKAITDAGFVRCAITDFPVNFWTTIIVGTAARSANQL